MYTFVRFYLRYKILYDTEMCMTRNLKCSTKLFGTSVCLENSLRRLTSVSTCVGVVWLSNACVSACTNKAIYSRSNCMNASLHMWQVKKSRREGEKKSSSTSTPHI